MTRRSQGLSVVVLCAVALLTGCKDAGKDHVPTEAEQAAALPPLLLSPEDVHTLQSKTLTAGPAITGSILPEGMADLRAEVSAIVLAVLKENGDKVKRGDLLVRLDETSIRDTLRSREAAAQTAEQAYEQAQRQYERLVKLQKDGLISLQQLEDAEDRRNATQSDRESSRSNLVAARQQLQRTMVRAPFDGVVSDRKVSAGDTAQIGKELLKVIDPASLRFEGYVSADSIGALTPGQKVTFRIHGYEDKDFSGRITRINPAANSTTRQMEVLVSIDSGQQQPGVAGLYAEGRVETLHAEGLSLPADLIVRDGDNAFAWRVQGGKLHKVKLVLGDRDARSGEFVIKDGLAAGDVLLRYPTSTLHDGQAAQLAGK
ncbi:MAG: efflux RND transporter periplasmic adaptor subunit [Pseudomonadota bacterium]